jgi:hypothetical protein
MKQRNASWKATPCQRYRIRPMGNLTIRIPFRSSHRKHQDLAEGSIGSGSIVPASAGNKPFWFWAYHPKACFYS